MGLLERVRNLIDPDDFDEEDLYEPEEEKDASTPPREKSSERVPAEKTAQPATAERPKLTVHTTKTPELSVDVHRPTNFDQVSRIADDLLAKRAAIVNFERVEAAEKQRIFDFVNGVSYVLECKASKISEDMMLYVPGSVDVSAARRQTTKK